MTYRDERDSLRARVAQLEGQEAEADRLRDENLELKAAVLQLGAAQEERAASPTSPKDPHVERTRRFQPTPMQSLLDDWRRWVLGHTSFWMLQLFALVVAALGILGYYLLR